MRSRCGHDAALRTVRHTRRLDAVLFDFRFIRFIRFIHFIHFIHFQNCSRGHAEREATRMKMSDPSDEHRERTTAQMRTQPIYGNVSAKKKERMIQINST
jgi:hypothetical protein